MKDSSNRRVTRDKINVTNGKGRAACRLEARILSNHERKLSRLVCLSLGGVSTSSLVLVGQSIMLRRVQRRLEQQLLTRRRLCEKSPSSCIVLPELGQISSGAKCRNAACQAHSDNEALSISSRLRSETIGTVSASRQRFVCGHALCLHCPS
jgi:hypothetical protein